METIDTQTWIIVAGVVVLALDSSWGVVFYRRQQSHKLKERFGRIYGRTVNELGSRTKGESELKTREKRVEHLEIVPLAPSDADRFRWGVARVAGPLRR